MRDILVQASLLLNIGKNLMPEQVDPMVDMIIETPEYRRLTVADFRLAIIRGIQGKYGNTYDRFDIMIICTWLDKYWSEFLEYTENNPPKPVQENAPSSPVEIPEWVYEKIGQLEEKPKLLIEPDEFMIQQWKTDYDSKCWKDKKPSFENYCKLQIEKLNHAKK